MDVKIDNSDIPQWKKDLIARLRNQNKALAASSSSSSSDSQHPASSSVSSVHSRQADDEHSANSSQCSPVKKIKMVQERVWSDIKTETFSDMMNENYHNNGYRKDSASESDEDLHYGPGIVKKLKNRYLSLALRESNNRPSILHMRKATSLEHLLDDDDVPSKDNGENRQFQSKMNGVETSNSKNLPNRYLRRQGRVEMKRARSVEAISRFDSTTPVITTNNRQSLHEDMLISNKTEGSDFLIKKPNDKSLSTTEQNVSNSVNNNYSYRINRPKRIQPIMNEKEKPPADFVKQAKLIFERRPDQRTKKPPLTGEVAAKVGSFNNIIVKAKAEAKVSKKPPIKHAKPVVSEKSKIMTRPVAKPVIVSEEITKTVPKSLDIKKEPNKDVPLSSPIPDVSRIDFPNKSENDHNNLSETPDLILTSSPLSNNSPNHKKFSESFLREEIRNTSPIISSTKEILESSAKKSPSPTFLEKRIPSPIKKAMSPTLHSPTIKSPNLHSPTRKTIGSPQWNRSPTKKEFPVSSPTSKTPGSPVWSSPRELSPTKKITSPLVSPNRVKPASPLLSPLYNRPNSPIGATKSYIPPVKIEPELHKTSPRPSVESDSRSEYDEDDGLDSPGYKMVSPSSVNNISKQSNSSVFNFTTKSINQGHLPVNKNVSNAKVPPSEPLQIDVNVNGHVEAKIQTQESSKLLQESKTERPRSPPSFSFPSPPKIEKLHSTESLPTSSEKNLTTTEIEKNLINTVKTLQQPGVNVNVSVEVVNTSLVPKKLKPREQNSNTAVFDFRSRKDVPDYISNDKSKTFSSPELPKFGEVDPDEEILRSLEGPPSPCDVTFINDNILIDGKSSLSQKPIKRTKLKISFVEAGPEVYEYPSENSLLLDGDLPMSSPVQVGHSVPTLGGSYLANYTPKTTEDFLPGITRSIQPNLNIPAKPDIAEVDCATSDLLLREVDKPFSSGTNSDILF